MKKEKSKKTKYHVIADKLTNEEEDRLNHFLKNYERYILGRK